MSLRAAAYARRSILAEFALSLGLCRASCGIASAAACWASPARSSPHGATHVGGTIPDRGMFSVGHVETQEGAQNEAADKAAARCGELDARDWCTKSASRRHQLHARVTQLSVHIIRDITRDHCVIVDPARPGRSMRHVCVLGMAKAVGRPRETRLQSCAARFLRAVAAGIEQATMLGGAEEAGRLHRSVSQCRTSEPLAEQAARNDDAQRNLVELNPSQRRGVS